jgi:hypothetical protein
LWFARTQIPGINPRCHVGGGSPAGNRRTAPSAARIFSHVRAERAHASRAWRPTVALRVSRYSSLLRCKRLFRHRVAFGVSASGGMPGSLVAIGGPALASPGFFTTSPTSWDPPTAVRSGKLGRGGYPPPPRLGTQALPLPRSSGSRSRAEALAVTVGCPCSGSFGPSPTPRTPSTSQGPPEWPLPPGPPRRQTPCTNTATTRGCVWLCYVSSVVVACRVCVPVAVLAWVLVT